jgi:3-hydroxybutyryl-CoA dehydrogenase
MGAGIAFVAARGGYPVVLIDPDAQGLERARERIAKDAARAGDASIGQRVSYASGVPASSDAIIAIKAVPEVFDLKRSVLLKLEAALSKTAVIATNTSSLSVNDLADTLTHPQRMLGLHFFNPPPAMKLVEVIKANETSDDTLDIADAFVTRVGKTGVDAADTPGFIVNRVARPFYLQSMRAYERGVAAPADLDALARAAGFRMGPFELMDLIGLDINYATSVSVFERLDAPRLEPLPMQAAMVKSGALGRKTKMGFYDYSEGDPERVDLGSDGLPEDDLNLEEVVVVLGYGGVAEHLVELLNKHFATVVPLEYDDMIDDLPEDTTMVIDVGDGFSDRTTMIAALDAALPPEAVIFVDAYATDIESAASMMVNKERLVGYGILGALESQRAVELADTEWTSDDALTLASELFEALGKGVCLVEHVPGLFLGRVIGSIVNEAVIAVQEGVAHADDVDTAMKLGVNYPMGPIEWGREIGGRRIMTILQRVAEAEGEAFAPSRALWVLDTEPEGEQEEEADARA